MTRKNIAIYLAGILALLLGVSGWYAAAFLKPVEHESFDGQRALADVVTQVSFGPRTPGSGGHARVQEWMRSELSAAGWDSRVQSTERLGHPVQNIIAYRGDERPQVILGAHYDTRMFADADPEPSKSRLDPVPGANDGASGVAIVVTGVSSRTPRRWCACLAGLLRCGRQWAISKAGTGSWARRPSSRELDFHPEAAVIVDMIGDADQNIYIERNSNPELVKRNLGSRS
jgi:glutaminyl-peptide cyclotransferase